MPLSTSDSSVLAAHSVMLLAASLPQLKLGSLNRHTPASPLALTTTQSAIAWNESASARSSALMTSALVCM